MLVSILIVTSVLIAAALFVAHKNHHVVLTAPAEEEDVSQDAESEVDKTYHIYTQDPDQKQPIDIEAVNAKVEHGCVFFVDEEGEDVFMIPLLCLKHVTTTKAE